jgi:hypothetical protein
MKNYLSLAILAAALLFVSCPEPLPPQLELATPVISPDPGSYSELTQISLSHLAANATIYYTTDGSTPTRGSTRYTEPFGVVGDVTVKAIAVADGFADSKTMSADYDIDRNGYFERWTGSAWGPISWPNPEPNLQMIDYNSGTVSPSETTDQRYYLYSGADCNIEVIMNADMTVSYNDINMYLHVYKSKVQGKTTSTSGADYDVVVENTYNSGFLASDPASHSISINESIEIEEGYTYYFIAYEDSTDNTDSNSYTQSIDLTIQ